MRAADPSHQIPIDQQAAIPGAASFQRDGYQILRGVLPLSMCSFVSNYYRLLVANGFMAYNDGQVERGYAGYGLPLSETLLEMLRPTVARAAGSRLLPTYSYSRVYLKGADLKPHTDRPACEVSCSLTVDYESADLWPFCLTTRQGQQQAAALERGDALVYSGPEITHWRETFEGESQLQIFLHYVRQDGRYADLKFDRRPRLGAPEIKGQRRHQEAAAKT